MTTFAYAADAGYTNAPNASSISASFAWNAAIALNDVLVIVAWNVGGVDEFDTPTGYTKLSTSAVDTMQVFAKLAAGTEQTTNPPTLSLASGTGDLMAKAVALHPDDSSVADLANKSVHSAEITGTGPASGNFPTPVDVTYPALELDIFGVYHFAGAMTAADYFSLGQNSGVTPPDSMAMEPQVTVAEGDAGWTGATHFLGRFATPASTPATRTYDVDFSGVNAAAQWVGPSYTILIPMTVDPTNISPDRQPTYDRIRSRVKALPYTLDTGLLRGLDD